MALVTANFIPDSGGNTNAARIFRYRTADDSLATVKGSGYFDGAVNSTTGGGYGLRDGDVIFVEATDGESFLFMAVSASNVATTSSANDFV
jgi:hypothetical protein